MTGRPNTRPLVVHVPDDPPPVEGRAAAALLDLVEALAAVEVDDDHDAEAAVG